MFEGDGGKTVPVQETVMLSHCVGAVNEKEKACAEERAPLRNNDHNAFSGEDDETKRMLGG